jgi:ribosomal protein S27AE
VSLPAYSGNSACPKCGNADLHTRYIREGGADHLWRPRCGQASGLAPAHLDRHCRTCGFEWAEAPLDSTAPAAPGHRLEARDG